MPERRQYRPRSPPKMNPIRRRTWSASLTTSNPLTAAVPEVGMRSVVSILVVVVLPAPFGPRSPNNSPSWISKETSSTATISLAVRLITPIWETNVRRRWETSMAFMAELCIQLLSSKG